jgi:hypothetical protein
MMRCRGKKRWKWKMLKQRRQKKLDNIRTRVSRIWLKIKRMRDKNEMK